MTQPIDPYVMPSSPYDQVVTQYGIRMLWRKSHQCPCTFTNVLPQAGLLNALPLGSPGSAKPQCETCGGLGIYWDDPLGPFAMLLTYKRKVGFYINQSYGPIVKAWPFVTFTWATANIVWQQASEYDQFIEIDVQQRFNAVLVSDGEHDQVPYRYNLSIADMGAVTIWANYEATAVDYTVSGSTVTLSDIHVPTPYVVEYYASPSFIAVNDAGGMNHMRPFGQNATPLPRKMRLEQLDLYLRAAQQLPLGA